MAASECVPGGDVTLMEIGGDQPAPSYGPEGRDQIRSKIARRIAFQQKMARRAAVRRPSSRGRYGCGNSSQFGLKSLQECVAQPDRFVGLARWPSAPRSCRRATSKTDRAVYCVTLAEIASGTENLLTPRWRRMDSNSRPFTQIPAFLRLSEPRLQTICTPILLHFAPLATETYNLDLRAKPVKRIAQ
jgi:hypothetical protein